MTIMITGGAGYIGSHTVKYFFEQNEDVVVVDNLQSGHRESIDVEHFYEIDLRDNEALDKIFKTHSIEAVIHFAANSLVGESMEKPFAEGTQGQVPCPTIFLQLVWYGGYIQGAWRDGVSGGVRMNKQKSAWAMCLGGFFVIGLF